MFPRLILSWSCRALRCFCDSLEGIFVAVERWLGRRGYVFDIWEAGLQGYEAVFHLPIHSSPSSSFHSTLHLRSPWKHIWKFLRPGICSGSHWVRRRDEAFHWMCTNSSVRRDPGMESDIKSTLAYFLMKSFHCRIENSCNCRRFKQLRS